MIKEAASRELLKAAVHPEVSTIILTLNKSKGGYYLQPSFIFKDGSSLEIEEPYATRIRAFSIAAG